VEKLGSMTPEELEALPEIGIEAVEQIQLAVNSYYSQFETTDSSVVQEEVVPEGGEWPADQAEAGTVAAAVAEVEAVDGDVQAAVEVNHAPVPEEPPVEEESEPLEEDLEEDQEAMEAALLAEAALAAEESGGEKRPGGG